MKRTAKHKKLRKKGNWLIIILKILFIVLLVSSAGILGSIFILTFYELVNLESKYKILLTITLSLPFFVFCVIILKFLIIGKWKWRRVTKILTLYLAILLFFSSGIVAFEYLKKDKNKLSVPDLPTGSIGFRAWNAEVWIESIEIYYQDAVKKWIKVDDSIVNNPESWIGPIKPKINDTCKVIKNTLPSKGKDSLCINLKNCGIRFSPKTNRDLFLARNVHVKSKITFLWSSELQENNPGFNIVLRYDTTGFKYDIEDSTIIVIDDEGHTSLKSFSNSDPCIEFAFPFLDNPHLWIPGLEWEPAILRGSNSDDYERIRNIKKKKKLDQRYVLSAFIFDGSISFKAEKENYAGSGILLEAEIKDN